jgi:hypothetical protein
MKFGRGNLVISFLLLFLFLTGFDKTRNYATLSDLSFEESDRVAGFSVYRPNNSIYDSTFLNNELKTSNQYFKKYANKNNIQLAECNNATLEIFVVDMAVINSTDRYPWTTNTVSERWALYDPYDRNPGLSVIILTDHNDSVIDSVLFAHELGHYWYDKYCLMNQLSGTTEDFAIAFQDFYTVERYGRKY